MVEETMLASEEDDELVKKPIKYLEIPINKFNNEAIPHHLELLKKHKLNIKKYQNIRNWDGVYTEQICASRIIKQLTQLLYEMDSLRAQVLDKDIVMFDKLTQNSKTNTLNAIKEYSDLQLNLPLVKKLAATKENKEEVTENPYDNRFLQVQAEKEELERQEACLEAFNSLQNDIVQLQQIFVDFNKVVHEQAESVNRIEENVEDAELNVNQGLKALAKASKYKTMTYPLAGAVLGTCVGGPIGLLAGLKIGTLAALGGGVLGFTSGKIIKEKTRVIDPTIKAIEAPKPAESSNNQDEPEADKSQL